MSNFLEDIAYRQYENKLPKRYEEEPVCNCCSCGDDIFEGEEYYKIGYHCYCEDCVEKRTAEREDF